MSKKRRNEIPDFSKKPKDVQQQQQQHGVPDATKPGTHAATPPPVRASKPPTTSMKSGRRGS